MSSADALEHVGDAVDQRVEQPETSTGVAAGRTAPGERWQRAGEQRRNGCGSA